MKKIFIIATLVVAFGVQVNAQESKVKQDRTATSVSKEESVKMQTLNIVEKLDKLVALDPSLKSDFISIIYMRNEAMNQVKTIEDKKAVFAKYGEKMMSVLSASQRETVKLKSPDLYKSLLFYNEEK